MISRLGSLLARLAPWGIIALLIYAAAFIKMDVETTPLPQPLVEGRDQFFGAAQTFERVWIVGQDGSALEFDEQSGNWQRLRLQPEENLQAIVASPEGVAVAVGNQGMVWVRAPGGDWEHQQLDLSDIASKLIDVAYIDGHFWLVGEMGALYRADPSGRDWQRQRESDDVAFNRIRSGPDGSIWIAAEFGRLYVSHDGGATWASTELGSESLYSIAFNSERGLAVGNRGEAYVSLDGGDNWTRAGSNQGEHLYDVIAQGDGWLVAGARGALYEVGADGAHWLQKQLEGLPPAYVTQLLPLREGVLLVGKMTGVIDARGQYRPWPVNAVAVQEATP